MQFGSNTFLSCVPSQGDGFSDAHAHPCVCEGCSSSHKAQVPLRNLPCAPVCHEKCSIFIAGEYTYGRSKIVWEFETLYDLAVL
jgi:hypothetical protein